MKGYTASLVWILLLMGLRSPAQQAGNMPPPLWMKDAIIYGIKPSSFTDKRSFKSITKKLNEISFLGANTLWLQPINKTGRGGQGYDVIDYFKVREDLGTAEELKELIDSAHALNIRVIFDFVPNHTSLQHPYAADIIDKGKASEYYDYYQHENDGAPYSSFYHRDENNFIYYFWKNLVNLNYDHAEVKKMITNACKYWVTEFDIDGYRFDASWGVRARSPEFFPSLRKTLKSLKPDILLLAEDKGADSTVFSNGFDAAYDWTADTSWVSHWPWEYEHSQKESQTIFNHPDESKRIELLKKMLFTNNPHREKILRFMENNDLPRFVQHHSLAQTRMAAAFLLALPGIPLIFCGQETGVKAHPYTSTAIFRDSLTIQQVDSFELYKYYQQLIDLRKNFPALLSSNLEEVPIQGSGAVAFRRWHNNQHIVVLVNPLSTPSAIIIPRSRNHFLKRNHSLTVPALSTRWLLLKNHSLIELKSS